MSRISVIDSIEVRRDVWKVIAKHRGARNAITAKEISNYLWWNKIDDNELTEVQVRMIIKAIIEEEDQVICSNEKGFFIPETAEEALKYAESLKGRIISINKRLNSLKHLIPAKFFKEMQMELGL